LPTCPTIESVELAKLPDDWLSESSLSGTAELGTEWAHSLRTAVLRVPSAVIPAEFNYILNPLHPDFAAVQFQVSEDEYIDERLRK
jgi:RES domain-containing protein